MKAKIYVSSSTSLEQVQHSYSISVIPDIIEINGEVYEDAKQISPESFCVRLKFEDNPNVKIYHKQYEELKALYKQAKTQGYTDVLYLLSPYEYDMEMDLIKLQNEFKDDSIIIYKASVCSYLLGMIALEADKQLRLQLPMNKVIDMIERMSLERNSGIRIFKQGEDETVTPFTLDLLNTRSIGDSYVWTNGQFIMIGKPSKKRNSLENPFRTFIKTYFEYTEGMNLTPVILYSFRNSVYLDYFRETIKTIYPKLRTIKEIALAPRIELDINYGLGITYLCK